MKNYYEILEVDKKASSEVIDKVYKILVKRYHPDLQKGEKRKEYEEKLKEVNEAYDILSNDYKKTIYDKQLENTMISIKEYEKVVRENEKLEIIIEELRNKNQFNNTNVEYNNSNIDTNNLKYNDDNTIYNIGRIVKEDIKRATKHVHNKTYKQPYVGNNIKYKIKYNHDAKYYIKFFGCIIICIMMFALIYQIPIVKRFCIQLYEENLVIKTIVNIFKNTFSVDFW